MRDYPTLHLDTNESIRTTCSKKRIWMQILDKQERLSNITLRYKLR